MSFFSNNFLYTFKISILRRYFIQGFLILYHEGLEALKHRIRSKLLSKKHSAIILPYKYRIEKNFGSLTFPIFEQPVVSIIIPMHNKPHYTYTCLKSISENTKGVPYEIILVDDCSDGETHAMVEGINNIRIINNSNNLGFIKSCNKGAIEARGQYLVFLNNDTIVTKGWLRVLLTTFKMDSEIGLVGCKLVYPDGRLQEAGGIIWKDGSAWNYGRFDNQNKPEYNYFREVDYCSGACIIISRQLFFNLGLFDEWFAPAYYEDSDLAFKVRKSGKKVYYQPRAKVVHFEGVSLGTNLTHGLKRYQEINRRKFYKRWKLELAKHQLNGVNPEFEKERKVNKRIFVVDARMIRPDRDAGSLRMYNILISLKEMGNKVTFAQSNLVCQQPYVGNLQEQGIEVIFSPHVNSIESYLKKKGNEYDVIILSRADLANKLIDRVRKYCPEALVIFDTVDLHFIREQRMAEVKKSHSLRWLAAMRKKQELEVASKADITLVVSPFEQQVMREIRPNFNVELLTTIYDIHETATAFNERTGILFVGAFEHPPNIDAVIYFVRDILPLIRQKLNGIETYIVGNDPPPTITSLKSDDIFVTGYVKDIAHYYQQCRVFIAPLRFGSGIKGKVNMSMSYGLPVVGTSIATEGMNLANEFDVMISDNPRYFADAVAKVYNDEALWNKLSANGKLNIQKYFSKQVAKETLKNILKQKPLRFES